NAIGLGLNNAVGQGRPFGIFAARTATPGAAGGIVFINGPNLLVGAVGADAVCGFPQVDGVITSGSPVTLIDAGSITLGDGTPKVILAANSTVDLIANGVRENAGSFISAANLRLLGGGAFTLDQGNAVGTLAASVAGPLVYNDVNDLVVGVVN